MKAKAIGPGIEIENNLQAFGLIMSQFDIDSFLILSGTVRQFFLKENVKRNLN